MVNSARGYAVFNYTKKAPSLYKWRSPNEITTLSKRRYSKTEPVFMSKLQRPAISIFVMKIIIRLGHIGYLHVFGVPEEFFSCFDGDIA